MKVSNIFLSLVLLLPATCHATTVTMFYTHRDNTYTVNKSKMTLYDTSGTKLQEYVIDMNLPWNEDRNGHAYEIDTDDYETLSDNSEIKVKMTIWIKHGDTKSNTKTIELKSPAHGRVHLCWLSSGTTTKNNKPKLVYNNDKMKAVDLWRFKDGDSTNGNAWFSEWDFNGSGAFHTRDSVYHPQCHYFKNRIVVS